jgi:hypothetical protein
MKEAILSTLGRDEWEFLEQDRSLSPRVREFYYSLKGSPVATIKYFTYTFLCETRDRVLKVFPSLEDKLRRAG